MSITIVGIIIILMSIYAFFKNQKLLLYMLVFFSTFTALKVVGVNAIKMPVLPFEYIGAVWLLREFVNFIKTKPKINKEYIKNSFKKFKENKLAVAIAIFMCVSLLGAIYLLVSGLSVEYINFREENAILKFGFNNIKQIIIVEFILLLTMVLSFKIKTKEEIRNLIKVFCISTIFAIIWGFIQFIIFYFKIPYPAFLFNNNEAAAQCYDQVMNNIKRISSIALEPSTFSVNLICFMPFALGAFLQMKGKLKEKQNITIMLIIFFSTACAILTTSSTAYIGLICVYGIYGIYTLFTFIKNGEMSNRKTNFLRIFIATVVSIMIAGVFFYTFVKIGYKTGAITTIQVQPDEIEENKDKENTKSSTLQNILETLKQATVGKLLTGSGQERMNGEEVGMTLFKYSPIVGIGLGSYRTFGLFTNILLNTGIIGIASFIYIIFIVIKEVIKNRKENEVISVMFLASIISTTIIMFISIPDYVYIFYWFMLVFAYKYMNVDEK